MKNGPAIPDPSVFVRAWAVLELAPLFVAALLFAVGILLARLHWVTPAHLMCALAALALLCGLAASRALRVASFPLAVLFVLLGTWCAEMEPQPAADPQLLSVSDGLLRTVEGTIVDAAPIQHAADDDAGAGMEEAPAQRVDVRLKSIEFVDDFEDRQGPVDAGVRLTIRWPHDAPRRFNCGELIRADVRLLPPEVYRDAGAWNRRDYLLQQGITSTGSVSAERIERLATPASASFACVMNRAQRAAGDRLMSLPAASARWPALFRISTDDAAMLTAMVSGDRTFLDHTLRVGFERTGSFHMLVVSGFHLAIVAGVIVWLARRLRIPRVPATLLTIAGSTAFALFTGFAAPVQRSLFMVSLYLVARLFYRERNVLNAIGFAGLGLLAVSPHALFEASFQMTLLAVLSIGGIASPLLNASIQPYLKATRDLRLVVLDAKLAPSVAQFRVVLRMFAALLSEAGFRRVGWSVLPSFVRIGLRITEAIVVAFVIELAMTLPMAVYFHRITLFALPVNLFILPILLVLLPAAILTLILLFLWPAAASIPAAFTSLCLHIAFGWVRLFGSMRGGDLRLPIPHLWQMALFWIALAAAIVLARCAGRTRRLAWVALLVAALAAVFPTPVRHPAGGLLVQALDVGQGDSLLLITPEGKTLLVDGGGFGGPVRSSRQGFDIGEEVVSAALWQRGIRHLDAVALSHAHLDHMGGLPAVLRNFHPDELWVGNNPPSAPYHELLDEARAEHTAIRSFRMGDRIALGSVHIRVLAPFADYQPGPEPANNDSLVLRAEYGATSVLLEGDAEAPVEERMLSEPLDHSTLLKVGHHGSLTSTRPQFLAAVAPGWAVISCGLHNHFGHPRDEILAELQAAGVRTFSTDIHGAVCFLLDGSRVQPISCAADQ